MKLKHIVLTTDLSESALRAFAPVAELAKENGAKITLLHVVPDLLVYAHGASLAPRQHAPEVEQEMARARESLEAQAKSLGSDVPVQLEVLPAEDFAKTITKFAADQGADLIALSTHGHSGFKRLVLGSTAEAIIRHATVPVLAIPPGE